MILFGIATAYSNSTASEWRAFWDKTGRIWFGKDFFHKTAGIFVSTGTPSSGQENVFTTLITALAHHGMYYVPLGYKYCAEALEDISEVNGGTAWGAGTYTVCILHLGSFLVDFDLRLTIIQGASGLRQPSARELELAEIQGKSFYQASCRLSNKNVLVSDSSIVPSQESVTQMIATMN